MSNAITPSLESITVRAKYLIPEKDFSIIAKQIREQPFLSKFFYIYQPVGESIKLTYMKHFLDQEENDKQWYKTIENTRSGGIAHVGLAVIEHQNNGMILEVECRPMLWFKIATLNQTDFNENDVQEALIECGSFIRQFMSLFKGKEIEPISVYPIIQRTEIKSRLLNLGLKETVEHLDKAEKHIVQNNFEESLKSSRTAFEKMIDWELKKRLLEETNNYKNNLERLKSKGFIDSLTTELMQTYYHCLSGIVHGEAEVKPGFYEAQMGYGMTLIMLQYFADKLP